MDEVKPHLSFFKKRSKFKHLALLNAQVALFCYV